MNEFIQSVLLGIVEGLTEFLPVSSTAHLRITEALMHIPLDDAYWKMYTIVIQLGAILALLLLYLTRIIDFMRSFPKGEGGDRTWLNHPISLTLIAFAFTSAHSRPCVRSSSGSFPSSISRAVSQRVAWYRLAPECARPFPIDGHLGGGITRRSPTFTWLLHIG